MQERNVEAARRLVAITTNQYLAGTVAYLEVLTAQTTSLSAERAAVDIRARRMAASVALIKAIGGTRREGR